MSVPVAAASGLIFLGYELGFPRAPLPCASALRCGRLDLAHNPLAQLGLSVIVSRIDCAAFSVLREVGVIPAGFTLAGRHLGWEDGSHASTGSHISTSRRQPS